METKQMFTAAAFLITIPTHGLFCLPKNITAQEAPKKSQDSHPIHTLLQQTLDSFHNERFEDAIKIATRLRQEYPDEPAGAFGLLATYQTINRNYRVRRFDAEVDSLLSLSIELARKAVKRNKKDPENYFYLGSAYGMRCIYHASRRKWLAALRDGSNVLNNFNKAVAYNPEFYDSYYGIGLYKYWLGAKSKMLRALPFSKDKRNEGIRQIKLAIEKGRILKVDAMYGLSAAYFNEHEYRKALELTDRLYKLYPGNPTLLYRRGRILQALEKWQDAKGSFEELYDVLRTTDYQSVSYQVDCLYQAAKCEYHLRNYPETRQRCQDAMILEKFCDFSEERDGPLEKFSEIRKELHELNHEVKTIKLTEVKSSDRE